MKRFVIIALWLSATILTVASCSLEDKRTTVMVINPDRHYYPVIRGRVLDIEYEIENTGKNPLFITDIMTSCGCVVIEKASFKALPPGEKGHISMQYNSEKNIGHVKHYIEVYANLVNAEKFEISFDINVVTNALYTEDYEEMYSRREDKDIQHVGYYTDEDLQ